MDNWMTLLAGWQAGRLAGWQLGYLDTWKIPAKIRYLHIL